ncbi:Hypothetical predicted protein [Paramuricea clavata]|uniref:Uncharacterized protein n=1 Tax=Paramuricea clavata TaxID=317549 RepID=A0A6S7K5W0_PARCT|nr:Hypothetical predicted protein [Paramuricea clavata]
MAHSINMLDLIKACEAESELDFLQDSFMLTDEQKEAVLQQRIIFWTNAMAEDIERENPVGVVNASWIIGPRISVACSTKTGLMMMVCARNSNSYLNRQKTKRVKGASESTPVMTSP